MQRGVTRFDFARNRSKLAAIEHPQEARQASTTAFENRGECGVESAEEEPYSSLHLALCTDHFALFSFRNEQQVSTNETGSYPLPHLQSDA